MSLLRPIRVNYLLDASGKGCEVMVSIKIFALLFVVAIILSGAGCNMANRLAAKIILDKRTQLITVHPRLAYTPV